MQIWPDGTVLVELSPEPEIHQELRSLVRYVGNGGDCHVVLDFGNVTIITSRSLAPLLRLWDLMRYGGKRLLLCSMSRLTIGAFSITALDGVFEIVDDRDDALAALHAPSSGPAEPDTPVSRATD
jgi:anti-anti-sigma regulatory factor